jgi:hypothetical protein
MDGAPACPFVAFGDDREGRSTSPDHRHRCFAESPPAPRALAHQEAYCLSSAFPVCPTFQDWARREAAHARGSGDRAETAPSAAPIAGVVASAAGDADPSGARDPIPDDDPSRGDGGPSDLSVRRNPPRDWAAPPPWATGAGATAAGGRRSAGDPDGSDLLSGRSVEGRGLAGSAADRLAGGPPPSSPVARGASTGAAAVPAVAAAAWSASAAGSTSAAADEELAGLVQGRPPAMTFTRPETENLPLPARTGRRPAVSSTRPSGETIPGPSWERMRRYEAYPTIRSRAGLPGVPRIAVLGGALAIAALALFMLPALLGIGGGTSTGSPSPGASGPVVTLVPTITPVPLPTQQTYVIKKGDTLSKVANAFGITLAELLAANPAIKNPNVVALGQQIVIPAPSGGAVSPSRSPTPS